LNSKRNIYQKSVEKYTSKSDGQVTAIFLFMCASKAIISAMEKAKTIINARITRYFVAQLFELKRQYMPVSLRKVRETITINIK